MTCFPSSTNSARSAVTSGRWRRYSSALLASCVLASGSAAADSITQADADRIAAAIVNAMWNDSAAPVPAVAIDYDFVALGDLMRGNTFEGNPLSVGASAAAAVSWLHELARALIGENFNAGLVADWYTRTQKAQLSLDDLQSLLSAIGDNVRAIDKDTDGVWDKLDDIATASETLATLMGRPADQHIGYQTENLNGELAVSVRDADTASALESLYDALTHSLDGLTTSVDALLASNITVSVEALSAEAGNQVAESMAGKEEERYDELREENAPPSTDEDKYSAEHDGKGTASESDEDLRSYNGDEYELPTYEPDTSGLNLNADLVPFADIPAISPNTQDVTVFEGMDVSGLPGWQGLAGYITWRPWNRVDGTTRLKSMFEMAGRVMRGVWEVAFAVWLFLLVRREVLFYTTLGQEDTPARPIYPGDVTVV